jgi:hypothetical protein
MCSDSERVSQGWATTIDWRSEQNICRVISMQSVPTTRSLVSGLDPERLGASNQIAVVAAPLRRLFLAGVQTGKRTDGLADRPNHVRR